MTVTNNARMTVNGFASKAAALREIRAAGFKVAGLLGAPGSNPKVAKNGKVGVLTSQLHLTPANASGFEVCPMRSAGCTAACLHTAGNPAYMAHKFASRQAKTEAYFKVRKAFVALLAFEIRSLERKAKREGMQAGVRLNATSDLPWEAVALEIDGGKVANLMVAFPDVEFYDYTKVTKRAIKWGRGQMPRNYHLTFSKAEDNDAAVHEVLRNGGNVSVVMSSERYKAHVASGSMAHGWDGDTVTVPVTDGDKHDFRPVDPVGCVVALKAKGDARQDTSGFVLR